MASSATAPVKSGTLAAGTSVLVETLEFFDSDNPDSARFLLGSVLDDLHGPDGKLAVPAGSGALLVVRSLGKQGSHSLVIFGLNKIDAGAKSYRLGDGAKDMATLRIDEDSVQGPGHRDVHLSKQSRLVFKLDTSVQAR